MTLASRRARVRPLAAMVRPYRKELRYALISGVLHQVLFIASGAVGAYVVGRAVTGASYNQLYGLLLLVGVLVLAQVRTPWIESAVLNSVAFRLQVQLRDRIYAAFRDMPASHLRERRSGDLASTVIADVEVLQRFFAQALGPLPAALVAPALALLALTIVAPPLALVLAPFVVLAAVAPWTLGRNKRGPSGAQGAAAAQLNAEIVDAVQGLREVLAFGRQDDVLADLERLALDVDRAGERDAVAARAQRMAFDALAAAGTFAVLVAGIDLMRGGSLSRPLLATAVVLAAAAFGPLAGISAAARDLGAAVGAATRVLAVLDGQPAPSPQPMSEAEAELAPAGAGRSVSFREVTFRYAADLPLALDRVSFDAPAGRTVALVGHSGAGKSTCASLLLRFADPESGSITVGGVDVATLPAGAVRTLIAYIPQDTYLFNLSVRDNLRLARPDATDEEVAAAAADAMADELIAALPDGYDTVVGERGARLSGGQRQRIAIARALLQDAPILLMDESTSNLDTESERDLRVALRRLRSGRTTLVIAHREATIRGADSLVLLDHGRVAGVGTRDELERQGILPDGSIA